MIVLGISAFYHDSAAALIKDGQIIAAAQQERFSRIKHDHDFPSDAITYCLEEAGIILDDIDYVGNYYLFKLLGERSYLKNAFDQVMKDKSDLEPEVAEKYIKYPIVKEIIKE